MPKVPSRGARSRSHVERPPRKADLRVLPRWACVAFAARCVERVALLFEEYATTSKKRLVGVTREATLAAKRSVRVGRAPWSVGDIALDATFVAQYSICAGLACQAASEAAFAAWNDAGWHSSAADAARFSAEATQNIEGASKLAARAMWSDLTRLAALAKQRKWTDDSPISLKALGHLWPAGRPAGWPT